MNRALATRAGCAAGAMLLLSVALPAHALEFFDRRLQIHGFYEQQIRSIWEDFSGSNDWDLSQWYHVLDLEIEAEIAPDGFGPFDQIGAFARLEVRFDCVWSRGCGLFPNVDVYGDRPGRLPQRLSSMRRTGFDGTQFTGDTRRFFDYDIVQQAFRFRHDAGSQGGSRRALGVQGSTYSILFGGSAGLDGEFDRRIVPGSDDPAQLVLSNLDECLFAGRRIRGPSNGIGGQPLIHNIRCGIEPIHDVRHVPSPFRAQDFNDVVLRGGGGGLALPYRPAPEVRFDAGNPAWVPQGVWYPNQRLQQMLKDGEFDAFDQNFTVNELQWNRGASQQDEKELKEAYVELEMFDNQLWMRIGKQNIVWGKTELFSTTDQLNPADLALASLPTLEESRIAQWALRAVYSFYEVGPLQDVRAELAVIYDQFEPSDIGRCGEPYSPLVACNKTFGLLAHGQNGFGLAGEIRPPNPWNSWKGIDVAARIEWRYDRFSFALTDFYGYSDFPYLDIIATFQRNVDPQTGRPRKAEQTGRCRTGGEDACLGADSALLEHHANQTLFAWACATSVAFAPPLDPTACAQTIFNSLGVPPGSPVPISTAISSIAAGDNGLDGTVVGSSIWYQLGGFTPTTSTQIGANAPFATTFFDFVTFTPAVPTLLVPLHVGPADGIAATFTDYPAATQSAILAGLTPPLGVASVNGILGNSLSPFLTDEQEALLGCGPFFDTNCDIEGLDLLNAEASVLFQSWPGIQGTFLPGGELWDVTDRSVAQPGTVGFDGEAIATRIGFDCRLPGARGPGDDCYDPRVDGSPGGAVHPITGQVWQNELAIVSWNYLLAFVALSQGEEGTTLTRNDANATDVLDPNDTFSTERCSFARPIYCGLVRTLLGTSGHTRSTRRAGGNGRFGRRQFLWHGGNQLVVRYEKRNVLGFSMDFTEDTTKTNWGVEFTWQEGIPSADADAYDGNSEIDTFNLTVSIDRSTFVNFLNANRTFFFNTQWFFQYIEDYRQGHLSTGPWNVFFTFTATTGYFQDRLLPSMTFVYDIHSNSGAFIPQVTYRFDENFSATFGVAAFAGRWKEFDAPINDTGSGVIQRFGKDREKSFGEPGLSLIRERDEIFVRLRYTF